jgi:hypothetical protein
MILDCPNEFFIDSFDNQSLSGCYFNGYPEGYLNGKLSSKIPYSCKQHLGITKLITITPLRNL